MGYITLEGILEGTEVTDNDLEQCLRAVITAEIRAFNPDPTDRVMGVLRENHLLPQSEVLFA